jgi:hypothetical protein
MLSGFFTRSPRGPASLCVPAVALLTLFRALDDSETDADLSTKYAVLSGSSSKATYNANNPSEDRHLVKYGQRLGSSGWLGIQKAEWHFAAVFDGHGGWQVAQMAHERLVPQVRALRMQCAGRGYSCRVLPAPHCVHCGHQLCSVLFQLYLYVILPQLMSPCWPAHSTLPNPDCGQFGTCCRQVHTPSW